MSTASRTRSRESAVYLVTAPPSPRRRGGHGVVTSSRVTASGRERHGHGQRLERVDAESVGHPGQIVGHPAWKVPWGDRIGNLLRMGAVVVEQRGDHLPDLGVLAGRLGPEVDPF